MKKFFKSLLCFVLAAITALSCSVAALADDGVTPVILVHGMGAFALYENPTSESPKELSLFDIGSLFTTNNKALHTVINAMNGEKVDPNTLLDQVAGLLSSCEIQACDENGNSVYDVGIKDVWNDSLANHTDYLTSSNRAEAAIARSVCEKIGAQNVYAFNYDWRLDAAENGEKLDAYIENVKKQTGKSKVTLVGGSEGTVVIAAYVDAHKNDNELEKVVYLDGALNGVSVVNVFKKDVIFDKAVLCKYLELITTTYNNRDFDFNRLTWLSVSMEGAIGNLCDILNEILNDPTLCKKFYNEVLKAYFSNIPIFWEFVPYDDFDACVKEMSEIGFLNTNGGLYTKITKYHQIQGRLKSNIEALKAQGVEVAIIANYGCPAIGLTSQWTNQSDILIDTKYASVGATTAPYGQKLSRSKTKTNKYASLDEIIDASSCVLRDSTWFINGIQHMDFWYGSEATQFITSIIVTDKAVNTDSIKALTGNGQFVKVDTNQKIVEEKGTNNKKTTLKKVKAGKKKLSVQWKKKSSTDGYQLQYSTDSAFKKNKKTVKVKKSSSTKKTVKKLKSKKTYYVRVRTYKIVANKKVYSAWSKAKSVKVK